MKAQKGIMAYRLVLHMAIVWKKSSNMGIYISGPQTWTVRFETGPYKVFWEKKSLVSLP